MGQDFAQVSNYNYTGTAYIVFIDIDECMENISNCNQLCSNTQGSYICYCYSGYELDSDDHTCIDIDECAIDNGECEQNCHNTNGSYYCTCEDGYTMDDNRKNCSGKL